jgi:hypothetical protein
MEATMRATGILRSVLRKSRIIVHAARLKAVYFAVEALLNGGKLSLSSLGRAARTWVAPKHSIKRIDRLLGNRKLHGELQLFFKAITRALINGGSRPVILLDWTKIEYGKFSALTAAVPFAGRAMPILWAVYEDSKWGNREVHLQFLESLSTMLPKNCQPILVTDAGFQNTWFEMVLPFGWDWVGRVGDSKIRQLPGEEWLEVTEYYRRASTRAQDLGVCEVARKNPMLHRVILGKEFVRNPNRAKAPRRRSDRGRGATRAKERASEPWLLITSLTDRPVVEIESIYSRRMSIEECYRDAKCHRFGWSFEDAKSCSAKRYEVLLLVGTLAMLILLLVGAVIENQNKHWLFQANTVRSQRVLSLFFLGKQMVHRPDWGEIKLKQINVAFILLRTVASEQGA